MTVSPSDWEIAGIRSAVEAVKAVKTDPIDLTGLQSSLTKDVGLIIEDPKIVKKKDARVRVDIVIK